MGKRKTKKQKILSQQRAKSRETRIQELYDLRKEVNQLELKIINAKKANFKEFNVRNLKVFEATCNFLAPFTVLTGVTVGTFCAFGGGLPFYSDEIVKYKAYNLDYQTNEDAYIEEYYRTYGAFTTSLPNSFLTVYTPWETSDDGYTRYKREYDFGRLDELVNLDLYYAILNEDYEYLDENINDYLEEVQTINNISNILENDYFFDGNLYLLDKKDTLKYNETDFKNVIITIIEILISLGIGSCIAYFRNFKYLDSLRTVNSVYHSKKVDISPLEADLVKIKKKALDLEHLLGGKI